jgi:hypothetical protein
VIPRLGRATPSTVPRNASTPGPVDNDELVPPECVFGGRRPVRRHLRDGLRGSRRRHRARREPTAGVTGVAGVRARQRPADGAVRRCGNRGCLETVASTDAVLSLLVRARGRTERRRLIELLTPATREPSGW